MISIEPGLTPTGQRRFSIGFRLEFLREWDSCLERGSRTLLLREHSLDYNTVKRWLEARRHGRLEKSMTHAAKDSSRSAERAELARLRIENEKLRAKVEQSEAVQQILGKAYKLLEGITTSSTEKTPIPPALLSADEYADWLKQHKLS